MTKRSIILICSIFILIALTAMCASSGGAQAAERHPFTDRGIRVDSLVAQTGGATPCWSWKQGWHVWNPLGVDQYKFSVDVEWCANAQKTKVTKIVYSYCLDIGGYFDFDGCTKQKGSTGYASIGMYDVWRYHFLVNGILTTRSPSVRFDLYATGRVAGTVWYDN